MLYDWVCIRISPSTRTRYLEQCLNLAAQPTMINHEQAHIQKHRCADAMSCTQNKFADITLERIYQLLVKQLQAELQARWAIGHIVVETMAENTGSIAMPQWPSDAHSHDAQTSLFTAFWRRQSLNLPCEPAFSRGSLSISYFFRLGVI